MSTTCKQMYITNFTYSLLGNVYTINIFKVIPLNLVLMSNMHIVVIKCSQQAVLPAWSLKSYLATTNKVIDGHCNNHQVDRRLRQVKHPSFTWLCEHAIKTWFLTNRLCILSVQCLLFLLRMPEMSTAQQLHRNITWWHFMIIFKIPKPIPQITTPTITKKNTNRKVSGWELLIFHQKKN